MEARPTFRTSGGSGGHSSGARPSPDLLDVQRVGLVSEALTEPKTSGCRVSLEHCANLVWRLGQGWQSYWQQVF